MNTSNAPVSQAVENLIYSVLSIFLLQWFLTLLCNCTGESTYEWQLHAKQMRDEFRGLRNRGLPLTPKHSHTLQLSRQKCTASLWNIILTCYKSGLQELMGIVPFTSQGTGSHPWCEHFTPLQIFSILQVLLSSLRWLKCNNDTKSLFTLNIPASMMLVMLLFPLVCGLCDIWQDMAEIVNSCILVRCIISE